MVRASAGNLIPIFLAGQRQSNIDNVELDRPFIEEETKKNVIFQMKFNRTGDLDGFFRKCRDIVKIIPYVQSWLSRVL